MNAMISLIDRSITTIPNPELITDIGAFALAGCTNLTTGTFVNCTSIELGAFVQCTSITELNLPSLTSVNTTNMTPNVSWIVCGVADGCTAITLRVPNLQTFPYNFLFAMPSLKTIYADSCTIFRDIPFHNCFSLENIYCPNLSTIYDRTFGYLGGISKDITFHITNKTTDQILAMSLASHFGDTPTAKWTLFHFIGSDGSVEYDTNTSSWVATPNT